MKIATICLNSGSSKDVNIETAETLVRNASKLGAKWVVLPELFDYMGSYDKFAKISEADDGALVKALSKLSAELSITLFAGSFHEKSADLDKVYNTHMAFGPSGQVLHKYRKCHLFSLKNKKGEIIIDEGRGFLAGNKISSFEHEGWRLATAICYDLRFPRYFQQVSGFSRPDLIVVPAAFTKATGKAHWEVLLRARAIESQCYVVASNQVGLHREGYESYGHSMIISPWGEVIATTGSEVGVACAEISKDHVNEARVKIPIFENQRNDLT